LAITRGRPKAISQNILSIKSIKAFLKKAFLWFHLFVSADCVATPQHNKQNQFARLNASCRQRPYTVIVTVSFEVARFHLPLRSGLIATALRGPMQDIVSDKDVNAPCTTVGAESETIAVSGQLRDFRAVAACGGVASLAVVVIGVGILIKPPAASAVPSFVRATTRRSSRCTGTSGRWATAIGCSAAARGSIF